MDSKKTNDCLHETEPTNILYVMVPDYQNWSKPEWSAEWLQAMIGIGGMLHIWGCPDSDSKHVWK